MSGAVSQVNCASTVAQMNFSVQEVVWCPHGAHARCVQCTGRHVPQTPLTSYVEFCKAYSAIPYFERPSAEEAAQLGVPARSLAAGEILFPSFCALVGDLQKGGTFLDLGSGSGRAAVAWALLQPTNRAVGVEIRPSLHQTALQAVGRLPPTVQRRLQLHCGDLFDFPLDGADVILVNSTGFDDALMARIGRWRARWRWMEMGIVDVNGRGRRDRNGVMHKYRLLSKKGEGTFSEVLKAQSIKSGKHVAIKCMKNTFDSIDQVNNLREIQALRRLAGHPNIIKLHESWAKICSYAGSSGQSFRFQEVLVVIRLYNWMEVIGLWMSFDQKSIWVPDAWPSLLMRSWDDQNYLQPIRYYCEILYDEPTGRLALVFELMDMNVYEAIKGRRHYLPEAKTKHYMFEILKGLDHMHRNGIFHRDVKPENLLLLDDEADRTYQLASHKS
eukprot:s1099_g10.t1